MYPSGFELLIIVVVYSYLRNSHNCTGDLAGDIHLAISAPSHYIHLALRLYNHVARTLIIIIFRIALSLSRISLVFGPIRTPRILAYTAVYIDILRY